MLKFISLLGTGEYVPSNYYLNDIKIDDCCFVQHAILEIFEKQGIILEEIVILATEEARKRNWENNKFDNARSGLRDELKDISLRTNSKINMVFIPDGKNENELWQIFETILEQLECGDEIILDITHSFRYLPMLTFIVINYARIVKGCKLKAIYYGAFETLGSRIIVMDKALADRNAPIFDLTPFVELFDWTIGIDRYLSTGDVSIVKELTDLGIRRINEEIKRDGSKSIMKENPALLFEDPNTLSYISESMREFSDVAFTCRGQELTKAATELKKCIHKVVESTACGKIKPLTPILGMLKERFNKFSDDNELVNIIEIVKWCYNNQMYQQGLTILEEGLISYVCEKWDLKKIEKRNRKKVTDYAYKVINCNVNLNHELPNMDQKQAEDLFILIYDISGIRNDINHAGMRDNPATAEKFKSSLDRFIKRTDAIFNGKLLSESLSEKRMLLIFSHELTENQKEQAIDRFKVSEFIGLDNTLLNEWCTIPPKLDYIDEYLTDITKWIDKNGQPGDYALVQGDFGATMFIVDFCMSKSIIPVYATTERKVLKKKTGDTIKISREFEHVQFRKYQLMGN